MGAVAHGNETGAGLPGALQGFRHGVVPNHKTQAVVAIHNGCRPGMADHLDLRFGIDEAFLDAPDVKRSQVGNPVGIDAPQVGRHEHACGSLGVFLGYTCFLQYLRGEPGQLTGINGHLTRHYCLPFVIV